MASPHPKRRRTDPAESTPISLHAADCTESAEDLQRMRDLIQEDPSLLYSAQPEPLRTDKDFFRHFIRRDYSNPATTYVAIPPLWSACKAQHPSCVHLILQASGPENVKHLDEFKFDPTSYGLDGILSYSLEYGGENDTSFEIMKSLLDHGFPPNVEIRDFSKIKNPQVEPVLRRYKTTKLILPSGVSHVAVVFGYSKMLELLLEYGAYPDPVIVTESRSILPLYPTLGRHLSSIPDIQHPDVHRDDLGDPLLSKILNYHFIMKHVEFMKTLLVHGALLPTYYLIYATKVASPQLSSYILYPFEMIIRAREGFKFRAHNADVHGLWGVKSDGSMCRYYDIILEILKLYHQFGGSLWGKRNIRNRPCEGGTGECVESCPYPGRVRPCKTIIDVLREHIPEPDAQSMVVGEVQRMMSTPPSLQHSARLAIRRSMGYGCVRNLEALPLPDGLKKYLKFETGE